METVFMNLYILGSSVQFSICKLQVYIYSSDTYMHNQTKLDHFMQIVSKINKQCKSLIPQQLHRQTPSQSELSLTSDVLVVGSA